MRKFVSMAELKNRATQIVRDVEKNHDEVIVTKHSVPVAVLRQLSAEEKIHLVEKTSGKDLLEAAQEVQKLTNSPEFEGSSVEWIKEERR